MKKQMISIAQRKLSHVTTKLTVFAVSEDEWEAKEDTGKVMNNAYALYILRYVKKHLYYCPFSLLAIYVIVETLRRLWCTNAAIGHPGC